MWYWTQLITWSLHLDIRTATRSVIRPQSLSQADLDMAVDVGLCVRRVAVPGSILVRTDVQWMKDMCSWKINERLWWSMGMKENNIHFVCAVIDRQRTTKPSWITDTCNKSSCVLSVACCRHAVFSRLWRGRKHCQWNTCFQAERCVVSGFQSLCWQFNILTVFLPFCSLVL